MRIEEFTFNRRAILFGVTYFKRDRVNGLLVSVHFLFWCLILEFGRPIPPYLPVN